MIVISAPVGEGAASGEGPVLRTDDGRVRVLARIPAA